MRVTGLFVYPLKSAQGTPLQEAELDVFGVRGDRRWAVIGPDGVVVTQRDVPRLATLAVRARDDGIELSAPDAPSLRIDRPTDASRLPVRVWGSDTEGVPAGSEADAWVSRFMERPGRIVYMTEAIERPVTPRYGRPGDRVSFADGYPLLLTTEASLGALNARLERSVPMSRFRPNLVIDGGSPFAEDGWARIRVGGVRLRVVKPCARCVVTTVDQETGEGGQEPLRTLATFRRREDGKVLFGQNLVHDGPGLLRVGDDVELLETRS